MDSKLIEKAHSELKGELGTIYKKRKATQFFQKIMWAITALFFVFMILSLVINYFPNLDSSFVSFFEQFQATTANPYGNLYPLIGFIVLLYVTTYFFTRRFSYFKQKESETIKRMVKSLFPKVDFAQNALPPTNEIIQSKLFAWVKRKTPIHSYGQIRRKTAETEINIVDIGIVEQNVSNKVSGGIMSIPGLNLFAVFYRYIFKGIVSNKSADNMHHTYRGMFCWLTFKKKLKGHTVVLPKSQGAKLDRLISFKFKEEQKIKLEDPRFTEQFSVYSTDQVEARYVLSPVLMERIVALKEKFNQPILLSFHDRQMFMAVKNENGMFSFPSGKLNALTTVEELSRDIETALDIASELALN